MPRGDVPVNSQVWDRTSALCSQVLRVGRDQEVLPDSEKAGIPHLILVCLAGFYIMNEVAQVYFNRYNELLGRHQGIVTQIPVSASV